MQHEMANLPKDAPKQLSSGELRPAHWQQEVNAQCLLMSAQAAAAQQDWSKAEQQLGQVRDTPTMFETYSSSCRCCMNGG